MSDGAVSGPFSSVFDVIGIVLTSPLLTHGTVNITGMNRQTVNFSGDYSQPPVVIASPQTDNNVNNYPIPTIRNVTTSGFEIAVCVDD